MKLFQSISSRSFTLLFLMTQSASADLRFTFTEIGTLGGSESQALDINNLGQIVGWAETDQIVPKYGFEIVHPILWQAGVLTDLGTLDTPEPYFASAEAINDAGQIVGSSSIWIYWVNHAVLWDQGRIVDIGSLPGGPFAIATDINADGTVIGYAGSDVFGSTRSFTWTDSEGMQELVLPPFGIDYLALGINNAAVVVGDQFSFGSSAFRWQFGSYGLLDPHQSSATAVNEAGQVVGQQDGFGTSQASLWQNGIQQGLGTLGGTQAGAQDINEAGQIVGYSLIPGNTFHAFLWQEGMMYDLNDLVPAGTPMPLNSAQAINDLGQIVGYGGAIGQTRGFLLTPCEKSDLNCDGVTNAIDLAQLLGAWGKCDPSCEADLNSDGTVNTIDLAQLLGNWG